MVETENTLSRKEQLKIQLEDIGYIKTNSGDGYNKSLITYNIIKEGTGEFPFQVTINQNHPDLCNQEPDDYRRKLMMDGIIFKLLDANSTHINKSIKDNDFTIYPMSKDFSQDQGLLTGRINWPGIMYLDKVFEQLQVPNFDSEYYKAKKLPKAKFLEDLGFSISRNKEKNNRLVGNLSFCHVEHAQITEPTPEQESYVPYEWKVRLDIKNNSIFTKILKKDVKKICVQIIKEHGSPKYRDGEKNYLKRNPIFFRVDDAGVEKIARIPKTVQHLISMPTGQ